MFSASILLCTNTYRARLLTGFSSSSLRMCRQGSWLKTRQVDISPPAYSKTGPWTEPGPAKALSSLPLTLTRGRLTINNQVQHGNETWSCCSDSVEPLYHCWIQDARPHSRWLQTFQARRRTLVSVKTERSLSILSVQVGPFGVVQSTEKTWNSWFCLSHRFLKVDA